MSTTPTTRTTTTVGIDRFDLMIAFSTIPPECADAWIDHHLVGMPQTEIAAAEGIGRGGASYRVKVAESAIRRYVRERDGRP